jgi:glutamine amidotransferase-like uncharacterized protein
MNKLISVRVYHGNGADPEHIEAALCGFGFAVAPIFDDEMRRLTPVTMQVLYLPGGWYQFGQSVNSAITNYVRQGGGIVGTCAGSYLVGSKIGLFPSRTLRANFRGRLYLEPRQKNHPILNGVVQPCTRHANRPYGEPIAVTHLGGPLIFPEDKSQIVLSYDFEGEAGALVAAEVGQGRAVAIASHPELPLAELPTADMLDRALHGERNLPQGDARLLMKNAVTWAARADL